MRDIDGCSVQRLIHVNLRPMRPNSLLQGLPPSVSDFDLAVSFVM